MLTWWENQKKLCFFASVESGLYSAFSHPNP